MRVAFLTHEPFHPPSGGGSAEAVYLVRELVRRGHEVHLFCPAFPDSDAVAARCGFRLHPFNAWPMGRYTRLRNFKYLAYPAFLRRLVERTARNLSFDVILSQHAVSAVAAGQLRRRLGVPVVMNFLDYLTGFMETWPRYIAPRFIIRALERYELSLPVRYQADGVLTVSDTLADYFRRTGFPDAGILPMYYGYDASLFTASDRIGAGEPSRPVVVMHGSFDHHHLGAIAAEAVRHVAERRPEVEFRFVGRETPALLRFRAALARSSPQVRLVCTGFIPYTEVHGRLADASLGIVPYQESTGTHCAFVAKIVEYLGVGLPVVSTPLDSARRYFGAEPAVRFADFDGSAVGGAVLAWLATPLEERRRLGRTAGDRVRAALDWDPLCKKAIDFVEKIAHQHRQP